MLGCKGLMFGHLRMMHFVVVIWPKGFLLLLFARTSKDCFQGYDDVRVFLQAKYR